MSLTGADVLALLAPGRMLTAGQIAARTGSTPRSVRRRIAALRDEGYRIDSARGAGGGYLMRGGSVLPPLQFSADEAFLVTLALRNLDTAGLRGEAGVQGGAESDGDDGDRFGDHPGSPAGSPADSALTKLRSVLPAALRSAIDRAEGAVLAVPGNEPEVPLGTLLALASAAQDRVLVDFGYRTRERETQRRVEPYRTVLFGGHWYLFAWDREREDWRTFRLDRMGGIRTTTLGFAPREHPDPVEQVRRGVTTEVYEHEVRVRVEAPANEVSARIPARAGTVRPLTADACEVSLSAEDPQWIAVRLLTLPRDFTVLEPESFTEVLEHLRTRLDRALGER
ncbi:helix-turn-helix transcriptional regulator [Brevibacterium samyangense]|uniref:YafY family protein n=1 Tax=Brevibacterium samyangense TaxID=366888 RepID=A0ABP5ETH0_9MICO